MEKTRADVVVIGAGPGGYVAAIRAAQLGMKVACVEKEGALGGTCLRVGCIPSKALLESSERYLEAREGLAEHGVVADPPRLDLGALMRRKERIVSSLTKGVAYLLKKNGVRRLEGTGRLDGPGKVVVEGADAAEIEAAHIVLATGSGPASLPGVELDCDRVGTSTEALSYPEVPARLAVIGAGFIGLELGSVWRRLGSEVTVIEYLDRILPGVDSEIAKTAMRSYKRQGLRFVLGARVSAARAEGDGAVVEVEGAEPIRADRVLVAAGRVPYTDGLGLETVGIEPDARGFVAVDEDFATSAPGVRAIGDLVGGAMLAHKASHEGVACAQRMAGLPGRSGPVAIPGVVYTDPEVAAVGLTEEQLADDGILYRKGVAFFKGNGRAVALGRTDGLVKILAHADTDLLLGAHIVGPRAGDLIAEAAFAIERGASRGELADACHAHPSLSEALSEAALAADGRAIHA